MKSFKILAVLLLVGMAVSCSDDDDEILSKVPTIETEDGSSFQLTRVGNYWFNYDSETGQLTSFKGDDLEYKVNGNLANIVDENKKRTYKILRNGNGYITGINASWDVSDGEELSKRSVNFSFSYNNSGNLTNISGSASEKETYKGKTSTYNTTYKASLSWSNGNLVRVSVLGTDVEDGDKDSWNEEYEMEYGSTENVTRQGTKSFLQMLSLDNDLNVLAFLGLFGKAPKMFPTRMTGDDDGYRFSRHYSYSINSDGTIYSETVDGSRYYYSYCPFGDNIVRKMPSVFTEGQDEFVQMPKHRLFGHCLRNRK